MGWITPMSYRHGPYRPLDIAQTQNIWVSRHSGYFCYLSGDKGWDRTTWTPFLLRVGLRCLGQSFEMEPSHSCDVLAPWLSCHPALPHSERISHSPEPASAPLPSSCYSLRGNANLGYRPLRALLFCVLLQPRKPGCHPDSNLPSPNCSPTFLLVPHMPFTWDSAFQSVAEPYSLKFTLKKEWTNFLRAYVSIIYFIYQSWVMDSISLVL